MNPEMYPGPERTPINKLEEAIEKLELVNLLQQSSYTFADELPEDVVDRAREIALLDSIDSIDTVKELTVIEFIIQQLAQSGASEEELAEEVESSLLDVAKLLLTESSHTATDEEARMVLRGALKSSPTGSRFTNVLLDAVKSRKKIRSEIK